MKLAQTASLVAALIWSSGAWAASAEKPEASKATGANEPAALFPGTSSKEPITVDADKLVYYDKDHKAIYTGNVVVTQGDTKMTCASMTVFLDHGPAQGQGQASPSASAPSPAQSGSPSNDSGIKHLDAAGPVTVISKTQVATGDNGSYDKAQDKVWLVGHVTLSDGQNVTKGDKLTYDLKSGQATIDTGAKSGRVHGQFIPNSNADATKANGDASKAK
jgi:lipopolysaccharide export system protein LptA